MNQSGSNGPIAIQSADKDDDMSPFRRSYTYHPVLGCLIAVTALIFRHVLEKAEMIIP
jgi:hypothetical protein